MELPKFLNYSSIKPLGIPVEVKECKFYSQTTFGSIQNTDTVRFLINSPGFLDPY